MATMKWLKESAELMMDPFPKKKSSVKSYLQSFVRVSVDSQSPSKPDAIHSWPSVDSNQPENLHPESSPHASPSSQMSFDYDKIYRRLSSRNSDRIRSPSSKSSEYNLPPEEDTNSTLTAPNRTNLLTPTFVSPVLCRVPGETSTSQSRNKTDTDQLFFHGTVQLFPSGTLILNYESLREEQSESRKLSQSYSCRKVLCSKYLPDPDQKALPFPSSGNLNGNDSDEISQVALQIRIFSVPSETENPVRKVTPITHSPKKMNKRKILWKSDNFTEIIL
jgi:hypothetical protein